MSLDNKFIHKTLMPHEKVEAVARFHWFYLVSAFLWLIFLTAAGFVVHFVFEKYLRQHDMSPIWLMLAVGLTVCVSMVMKYASTEIFLTSERLIYKRGMYFINIQEVDVEQLASDEVHQSMLGRLFGYGRIHVRCIEAADIWLPDIAHPYTFRNQLERMKHGYREHYMNPNRLYKKGEGSHH